MHSRSQCLYVRLARATTLFQRMPRVETCQTSHRGAIWTHCRTIAILHCSAPARLTVALAGYFDYSGTVSDLAARLGAISESKGMLYWSVSDDNWRKLITDAFALKTTDADSARADFTSAEILSGQILYSAQKDSRSWGTNVLGMRVVSSSANNLVFKSYNETAIRMGPIKLIRSEDAQSVLFLGRVDDKTWKYYSLAVIKRSVLAARKKSLINRQYAIFRFLTGQKQDEDPPLAP